MCGVACAPVLRALVGASWAAFLAVAPELGNQGRNVEVSRIGGSSKTNAKGKVKITYPDRALMLRLPVPLLRAHGTLAPPDD